MSNINIYSYIDRFQCLGADCEDTCCKGWGMQVDKEHIELYKKEAPDLLDAVTSGEAEYIMKRDPKTDYCIKFKNGLCNIHKDNGDKFLGDACHFYPRINRKFGNQKLMSAALSCPEIARSVLYGDNPFEIIEKNIDRTPASIKDYLPDGVGEEDSFAIISALLDLTGDESKSPELIISTIVSIAHSLQHTDSAIWVDGINMLINMAEVRLPDAEKSPNDSYFLLQTLAALIHASKPTARPNLDRIFKNMEIACGISINRETLDIMQNIGGENKILELDKKYQNNREEIAPILRRWIQAQLSISSFPFAGFGESIIDKAVILAVRFATVKLAIISSDKYDKDTIITIIQSISRFMDHLADPELSMKMYEDADWIREARLGALVGDC